MPLARRKTEKGYYSICSSHSFIPILVVKLFLWARYASTTSMVLHLHSVRRLSLTFTLHFAFRFFPFIPKSFSPNRPPSSQPTNPHYRNIHDLFILSLACPIRNFITCTPSHIHSHTHIRATCQLSAIMYTRA